MNHRYTKTFATRGIARTGVMTVALFAALTIGLTAPGSVWAQPETTAADADPVQSAIVAQVNKTPPNTLIERLEAVERLLNVRAYDLANAFINAATEEEADDTTLAAVQQNVGSPFFVRLLRTPEVRDAGTKLTNRVFAASDRIASDPKRITTAVKECIADDLDTRRIARQRLIQIGAAAVPPVLMELAKEMPATEVADDRVKEKAKRLRGVIVDIGQPAVPVLIGALHSEQPDLIHHAGLLLDYMKAEDAAPDLALFAPAVSQDDQATIAKRAIDALLCETEDVPHDEFDVTTVWIFDKATKRLHQKTLSTIEHAAYRSHLLARRLYLLQPDEPIHRQLFLGTTLGWTKLQTGLDNELPKDLERTHLIANPELKASEVDAALLIACRARQIPTAIAAAQLLSRLGDPEDVTRHLYTGLTTALRDPNPRVRFHAASAIIEIGPLGPYQGAADVANALSFAAASQGSRQIAVLHPQPVKAEFLAGLLRGLRYEAVSIPNGRELIRYARTHPDLELVIISEKVARPSWNEVTQFLAKDYHSANVPVCVLTNEVRGPIVDGILSRFPRAGSFPTPAGRKEMVTLLRDALPRSGEFTMSPATRVNYAAAALQTLQPLVEQRNAHAFYEWNSYEQQLVESISVPRLAETAAGVLGDLATPAAQTRLVDFASQVGRPAVARRAAAEAFAKAVERAGLMLTSGQISQQYQRYNDNLEDEEAAEILSSLLDSIESPTRDEP